MKLNNKMWDVQQFRKYFVVLHRLKKIKLPAKDLLVVQDLRRKIGWLNAKEVYILDQIIEKYKNKLEELKK